jgi:hypothetical protein
MKLQSKNFLDKVESVEFPSASGREEVWEQM